MDQVGERAKSRCAMTYEYPTHAGRPRTPARAVDGEDLSNRGKRLRKAASTCSDAADLELVDGLLEGWNHNQHERDSKLSQAVRARASGHLPTRSAYLRARPRKIRALSHVYAGRNVRLRAQATRVRCLVPSRRAG